MERYVKQLYDVLQHLDGTGEGSQEACLTIDGSPLICRYVQERCYFQAPLALPINDACSNHVLVQLLRDATGRFLCDRVMLAWDVERDVPMLWCMCSKEVTWVAFQEVLEDFLNVRQWWLERIKTLSV